MASKLNSIGITKVLDLKQAHSRTLRDQFSVTMAKTIAELNGILLNDLVPSEGRQRDMFFDGLELNDAQSTQMMAVLDAINQRYGRQTLKLGSEALKPPGK